MQEVAVSDRRTDCPKRRSVAGSALRTMRGHNRSRRERPADSDAADAPVKDGIRKDTTYYLYSPADRRLFRPSKYRISLGFVPSGRSGRDGTTQWRRGGGRRLFDQCPKRYVECVADDAKCFDRGIWTARFDTAQVRTFDVAAVGQFLYRELSSLS